MYWREISLYQSSEFDAPSIATHFNIYSYSTPNFLFFDNLRSHIFPLTLHEFTTLTCFPMLDWNINNECALTWAPKTLQLWFNFLTLELLDYAEMLGAHWPLFLGINWPPSLNNNGSRFNSIVWTWSSGFFPLPWLFSYRNL